MKESGGGGQEAASWFAWPTLKKFLNGSNVFPTNIGNFYQTTERDNFK
jgi:hypothetical protein